MCRGKYYHFSIIYFYFSFPGILYLDTPILRRRRLRKLLLLLHCPLLDNYSAKHSEVVRHQRKEQHHSPSGFFRLCRNKCSRKCNCKIVTYIEIFNLIMIQYLYCTVDDFSETVRCTGNPQNCIHARRSRSLAGNRKYPMFFGPLLDFW